MNLINASSQYQIIHQYQISANKTSYNNEILNDLKNEKKKCKIKNKTMYNDIQEEILNVTGLVQV